MLPNFLTPLLLLFPLSLSQMPPTPQPVPLGLGAARLQPCIRYYLGNCVSCPYNYHLNQNQCYLNISSCLSYSLDHLNQEVCDRCQSNSVFDSTRACSPNTPQLTAVLPSTPSLQTIAQQYGDTRFQLVSVSSAQADPFFNICNNYMLSGEYSHFISKVAQPIYSVSFFSVGEQRQYKILYQGSGGQLMMCIITISTATNAYQLNAFVVIASTSLIDNCALYNDVLQCSTCLPGYHLENNTCYPNIAGCTSYTRNICLQCAGYSLLVENRCVGCSELADTAKVIFWGGLASLIRSSASPIFSQSYLS